MLKIKKILCALVLIISISTLNNQCNAEIPYEKPNTQEEFIERVKQAYELSKDLRKIDHPKPFGRLTRVVDAGIKTWWEKKWEQYAYYIVGIPVATLVGLVIIGTLVSTPQPHYRWD